MIAWLSLLIVFEISRGKNRGSFSTNECDMTKFSLVSLRSKNKEVMPAVTATMSQFHNT